MLLANMTGSTVRGFILLKLLQDIVPSRTNSLRFICRNQTEDAEHTIFWYIKFAREQHTVEITLEQSIDNGILLILILLKEAKYGTTLSCIETMNVMGVGGGKKQNGLGLGVIHS